MNKGMHQLHVVSLSQSLPVIKLSNRRFEDNYRFDLSNERYLRKVYTEGVVREIIGSPVAISTMEEEWRRLQEDRSALRQIFPKGDTKVRKGEKYQEREKR